MWSLIRVLRVTMASLLTPIAVLAVSPSAGDILIGRQGHGQTGPLSVPHLRLGDVGVPADGPVFALDHREQADLETDRKSGGATRLVSGEFSDAEMRTVVVSPALDSDGDGLDDGDAIDVYGTSPLDADDGEVDGGSDTRSASSSQPVAYEASLAIHIWGNDQSTGTTFPFNQKLYVARPLGARCNPANGGTTCGEATLREGAPLTGSGVLAINQSVYPPSFTLPQSAVAATATGSLPPLSPYAYISTRASNARNASGFFHAGGGWGYLNFGVLWAGGLRNRVAINPGEHQFGGAMRLLGSMAAKRAHAYEGKFFIGSTLTTHYGGPVTSFTQLGEWYEAYSPPRIHLRYQPLTGNNPTSPLIQAWGFTWTTGSVWIKATQGPFPTSFSRQGYDNRTPQGLGTIQLVAPRIAMWDFPGRDQPWDRPVGAIGILKLRFVPEPTGWLLLAIGLGFLVLLHRLRIG